MKVETSIQSRGRGGVFTLHTPNAEPLVPIPGWVRESQSRRAISSPGRLVDMRRCPRGRLVFAAEASQLDEVADQFSFDVDAEIISGFGACKAASEDGIGGTVDNLVGGGADVVSGTKLEEWVRGARAGVEGEVLSSPRRVFVKVLTSARGVFVEVFPSAWRVFMKVLSSAWRVFDFRKVLSFHKWCRQCRC